jgi:hypothetical protein
MNSTALECAIVLVCNVARLSWLTICVGKVCAHLNVDSTAVIADTNITTAVTSPHASPTKCYQTDRARPTS